MTPALIGTSLMKWRAVSMARRKPPLARRSRTRRRRVRPRSAAVQRRRQARCLLRLDVEPASPSPVAKAPAGRICYRENSTVRFQSIRRRWTSARRWLAVSGMNVTDDSSRARVSFLLFFSRRAADARPCDLRRRRIEILARSRNRVGSKHWHDRKTASRGKTNHRGAS